MPGRAYELRERDAWQSFTYPVDALLPVAPAVLQHHVRAHAREDGDAEHLQAGGDDERLGVLRCPTVEEDVGADERAGVRSEGQATAVKHNQHVEHE